VKSIQFKTESFTLIELLVVIAIIGLLSSIVLVNTRGSRIKAQIAKGLEFSQTIQNTIGSEAVGIWDFDNCTAQDASGYGNNGTINGAICSSDTPYSVSGKNSLSFDGVDDFVDCGNNASLDIVSEVTISAWIKFNAMQSGTIVGKGATSSQMNFYFGAGNSGTVLRFRHTSTNFNSTVQHGYSVGSWHYITVTVDQLTNKIKFYSDGIQLGADVTLTGTLTANSDNLRIGIAEGYADKFNGFIDDVRIYSKALSQSQIQQDYVEGLEKHSDLALFKK
jgi:prepilin-type N-terminal cleavage/methylation domain-containing protein